MGTNTNTDILLFYDALKIMPEQIMKYENDHQSYGGRDR